MSLIKEPLVLQLYSTTQFRILGVWIPGVTTNV